MVRTKSEIHTYTTIHPKIKEFKFMRTPDFFWEPLRRDLEAWKEPMNFNFVELINVLQDLRSVHLIIIKDAYDRKE
jgi:hypothetical protein